MNKTLAACAVFAAAFAASLVPLAPAEGSARPAATCREAAQVDGALRCDDELEVPVVDNCGRAHELRAGDAVDTAACGAGRMSSGDLAALGVLLDANTATAEDLTSLPGVGPVIAGRIVQARPYAGPEDLLDVRGIGPITLSRITERLRFGPRPAP